MQALKGLLCSSAAPELQCLRIYNCKFTGDAFGEHWQGILASAGCSKIAFHNCGFDLEATLRFEIALKSLDGKVKTLELGGFPVRFSKPLPEVLANILGRESALKELHLSWMRAVADLGRIMQIVERSPKLECLRLDGLDSIEKCQVIAESLPKQRWLKRFQFGLHGLDGPGHTVTKRVFIRGFQRNTSLEEVTHVDYYGAEDNATFFTVNNLAKVRRYAVRNRELPPLIASPHNLRLEMWPSLFNGVRDCEYGPDIAYRSLLALGEDVQVNSRPRKRRRLNDA